MVRRLAAIVSADVVGYSRLMGADEAGTLAALKSLRSDVIEPRVRAAGGRIFKQVGDGVLAEFGSAVDAVGCALAIQLQLAARTMAPPERPMMLRIGINVGDVLVEGDDLYGDVVNIAVRLDAFADAGGICISGDVYRQVRKHLDCGFEDLGERTLKNIAEPVRLYRIVAERSESRPAPASAESMFDRPALAVLPFTNMSGDPEQEYFSDGLSEDVITALAAWRSFPVIARNSSFIYKGRAVDVKRVAHELGLRYVLEGSVRKGGDRLRVTAQLIEATTGHHLWAEKFDRRLADVFALQEEITRHIVATLEPELQRAEQRRIALKKPENLNAWDFCLRGQAQLDDVSKEGNARARALFERAIALDPGYSQAYTGLANSHHRDILLECAEDRAASLASLFAAARRAVAVDDASSPAHEALSTAYIWSDEHDLAIAEAERAVELDPNSVVARRSLGNKLDLAGRSAEGIAHLERALQLSPQDPQSQVPMTFLARAYLNARRYEDAVSCARKAIGRRPDYPHAHYILAIALGHFGRHAEARLALDACERLHPGFAAKRARWKPYRNAADNAHLHEGLRRIAPAP